MKKTRIIVVDDHAVVRMGFVALLESEPDFEVIGEAGIGVGDDEPAFVKIDST